MSASVLVVEDDVAQREQLVGFLRAARLGEDVNVSEVADAVAARFALADGGVDVVITDMRMPGGDGVDLVAWGRTNHPLVDFIVVTAYSSVETAVNAMRKGAHDFLTKPVDLDVLEHRLRNLLERRGLVREVSRLREQLDTESAAPGVVAASPGMQSVLRVVRKVAATDVTVLIGGESGAGKEVVADLVHAWSPRRSGPFLRVNCGALTESLLESELFGHVRGAFTGADRDRPGLFRQAHGGTLLLDEIGEISPATQVRLLRVLQEREVRRVGSALPEKVDVRVIAATNRDLEADVRDGRFRQDLLFRINTISVVVPPLRERRADLAALLPMFLRRYAEQIGVPVPRLSREAHDALMAYRFPGNVRELQNVIERTVILAPSDVVELADLPAAVRAPIERGDELPGPDTECTLPELIAAIERRAIRRALAEHGGVKARAARALGLPERVLRYKLKTYGINPTISSRTRRGRRPAHDD